MIFIMALVPNGQAGCWLKWVLLMLMLMPVMMVWTHYAATGLWVDDIIMANFLQLDFAEGIRMLFNGTGFFAGLLRRDKRLLRCFCRPSRQALVPGIFLAAGVLFLNV